MITNSMKKTSLLNNRVIKPQSGGNTSKETTSSCTTASTTSSDSLSTIFPMSETITPERNLSRKSLKRQVCSFDLSSMCEQPVEYPSRTNTATPSSCLTFKTSQSWGQFVNVSDHYTKHCKYDSTVLLVPGSAEQRRMVAKRRLRKHLQ